MPKINGGEETVSSENQSGKTEIAACRGVKVDPNVSECTKLNSECIRKLTTKY